MSSENPSASAVLPWWRTLNRYHWFVFSMACLAWLFDCLDQQLFIIARNPAIADLLPKGSASDVQKVWGGYATAIFVAGWATGGLIFGAVGDRIGRAKTLTLTVLLYSVFTGLSAFSQTVYDFCFYRFVTGLGVGGVFGLSVALVADSLPDKARPHALGLLQSLSAVGNVTAGLIAVAVGWYQVAAIQGGAKPATDFWKYLFWVGAAPAFLCVFIQMRLKEPEKWVKAREAGRLTGAKFGSYASLFGEARWRRPALLGMLLCIAGVVGLWGVGFFSPELVGDVISKQLKAENVPAAEVPGKRLMWTGINMIMQNIGAFLGMMTFTKLAHHFGRKPIFAIAYVAAFLSTAATFKFLSQPWHIFTLVPLMGFCQLALFAGFAIYLPELFPTRLRSTGVSFCYNVGRFIAASGPFTLGLLQAKLAAGAITADAKLEAFRDACAWVSIVFLVGLVALVFLPETKDRPMPED
ncbi:MAG: MFS transporter [Verrucomicrobia bacterium]|nr:MFS transporter [Verrucomicrobiota bacterium]